MRTLILIALTLSACGSKQSAHVNTSSFAGQAKLSDEDATLLYKLNQSHNDLVTAAGALAAPATHAVNVNDHVQTLTHKVASGTCQSSRWDALVPDFTKDFEITQTTNAGSCPLNYRKHWQFDKARSHLVLNYDLNIGDEEMRKVSDVTKVSAQGDFNADADKRSNGTRVHAKIQMPIQSQTLGAVNVRVIANTAFSSVRTESVVNAIITVPGSSVHIARIKWESRHPDEREYTVDNIRLTSARFQDLFSALALDEIMDNSLKMR